MLSLRSNNASADSDLLDVYLEITGNHYLNCTQQQDPRNDLKNRQRDQQGLGIEICFRSPLSFPAIGGRDAENDRDLILSCGLAVAVSNALEDLKAVSHRVTTQPRGAGDQELIEWILSS